MRSRWRALGVLAALTLGVLAASDGFAQTLNKRLGRSFDSNLYFPGEVFFTAEHPEAALTLAHAVGECVADSPCEADQDCGAGIACVSGHCTAFVDLQVGYVAVMTAERFCSILACTQAILPPECVGAVCDGSGGCEVEGSNAEDLCVCTPCDENDPDVPAQDLVFEDTFDGTSNASWALGQAEIVSAPSRSYLFLRKGDYPPDPNGGLPYPPTSVAQVRFPVTPGTQYLLHVKWTYTPTSSSLNCSPYSNLSLALSTGPASCE